MKRISFVLLTIMALLSVQSVANNVNSAFADGVATDTVACDYFNWYGTRYTQSGVYLHHSNVGAPDDVVDTLYLTINEGTHNVTAQAVCDSTTWQGSVYTASGTYTYSYTNDSNCASVDTLRLTVNISTHDTFITQACENMMWHNRRYTESGVYVFSYFNAQRCLSADTLHLTILHGAHNVYDTVSCNFLVWENYRYDTTGVYPFAYRDANNCPSVDTIKLTIRTSSFDTVSQTVCDSLRWHDSLYTASGTGVYTYNNVYGCESDTTLLLTVNYATHNTFDTTVCGGMLWNGMVCAQLGSDFYVYPYTNAVGCASADTLHLTTYIAHNSIQRTRCDSIRWHDSLYTESGVYTKLDYLTGDYCRNNDTLYLTIHHSTHLSEQATACESYNWHGTAYTASDTLIHYYNDNHNCPASDTLHLTVNYGTHNVYDTTSCSTLAWRGRRFATSGTHTFAYVNDYGCASVDTINLVVFPDMHVTLDTAVCDSLRWHGTLYTSANIYFYNDTVNGCPFIDTLRLDVDYSYNTTEADSACEYYYWNGTRYDQTGVYTHVASLYNACHNTDTLYLVIFPASYLSIDSIACDSLVWNGIVMNASGDTVYHSLTSHFCDVADTLHLTLYQSKQSTDSVHGCGSYTWIDGITYYGDDNESQKTLHTSHGCDSVVTLALTMGSNNTGTDTIVGCDSVTWNNQTRVYDTIVSDTLVNITGCDSVVSHRLHVSHSTGTSVPPITSCYPYRWTVDGVTYFADTTVSHILAGANAAGCDSTVTIRLMFTPRHIVTFDANGGTGTTPPADVCHGDELELRNNYQRLGYLFGGWLQAPNDTIPVYRDRQTISVNADDTLYAFWISNCVDDTTGVLVVNGCDQYSWQGITYLTDTVVVDTMVGVVPGGCDSIVTLQLTMHSSSRSVDVHTECDSLTWVDGLTYTASVDSATQSVSYMYTNVGGCDSTVVLHLSLNYSYRLNIDTASCDSLVWYDSLMHYTSATVEDRYNTVAGCDSIIAHNLTIYPSYNDTVNAAICAGTPYIFCGQPLTAEGTYDTLLASQAGCDSAVTVHLAVGYLSDTLITMAACDSIVWNDQVYTASIVDTSLLLNAVGCDSTVVTQLIVLGNTTMHDETDTVCDRLEWSSGISFTNSIDTTVYLQSTTGCDSIVNLHLTVNRSKSRDTAFAVCGTYVFQGTPYRPAALPHRIDYRGTTYYGCDSIVRMAVTVNATYFDALFDTICQGQSCPFAGRSYNTAGIYPDSLTTRAGCDSVTVLNLHVLRFISDTQKIVACDSLTWWANGQTYYANATASRFVDNPDPAGCDSMYYLQLYVSYTYVGEFDTTVRDTSLGFRWHDLTCDHAGDYTFILHTVDGCDSTLTMHLHVIETPRDTQSIELVDVDSWLVYPNPTSGVITLQGDGQLSSIELFDVAGRRVLLRKGDVRRLNLSDLSEGSYILRLTTTEGRTRLLKLIRQ